MAELYHTEDKPQRIYWDRKYYASFDDQVKAMKGSSTLYVGNLDFKTTEQQIHATFSRSGPIKRIIMGLNSETKTPCGFCFVEYYNHEHATNTLKFISDTVCGQNPIRCELDAGFIPGNFSQHFIVFRYFNYVMLLQDVNTVEGARVDRLKMT